MTQLEGEFRVVSWDEQSYDDAPRQPKFSHVRTTYELTGPLQGEASLCYLMSYAPESARYVGFATVTGMIEGREGTFVMQDIGTFENDVAKGQWTILPALGARELHGIRGGGHYAAGPTGASYLLDVSF
jgi:hypothetical protein